MVPKGSFFEYAFAHRQYLQVLTVPWKTRWVSDTVWRNSRWGPVLRQDWTWLMTGSWPCGHHVLYWGKVNWCRPLCSSVLTSPPQRSCVRKINKGKARCIQLVYYILELLPVPAVFSHTKFAYAQCMPFIEKGGMLFSETNLFSSTVYTYMMWETRVPSSLDLLTIFV